MDSCGGGDWCICHRLPVELVEKICRMLDTHTLTTMCLVSSGWRDAVHSLHGMWRDRVLAVRGGGCSEIWCQDDGWSWMAEMLRSLRAIRAAIRNGSAFSSKILGTTDSPEEPADYDQLGGYTEPGYVLTVSRDTGTFRIWQTSDGSVCDSFVPERLAEVRAVCFSGGHTLGIGHADGVVSMLSLDGAGRRVGQRWCRQVHGGAVGSMSVDVGERLVACTSRERPGVVLCDLHSGDILLRVPARPSSRVMLMPSASAERLVICGPATFCVKSWPRGRPSKITTSYQERVGFKHHKIFLLGNKVIRHDNRKSQRPSIVSCDLSNGARTSVAVPKTKEMVLTGSRRALFCNRPLNCMVDVVNVVTGRLLGRIRLPAPGCRYFTGGDSRWLSELEQWRPGTVLLCGQMMRSAGVLLVTAAACPP